MATPSVTPVYLLFTLLMLSVFLYFLDVMESIVLGNALESQEQT